MSRYRAQIAAALGATVIRGPTRYVWLGRASRPLPADFEAELDDRLRRGHLTRGLADELYYSFYCAGRPVPARWGEPQPLGPDPVLAAALSAANTGRGGRQRGWTVERVEHNGVVTATARIRARIPRDEWDGPAQVAPGAEVTVRLPKDLPALSPGFHTVVSDAPLFVDQAPRVLRTYWHVTHAGAAQLVHALTQRLNAEGVPFRLKVADHPFRLDRCDAAVLYLDAGSLEPLRPVLLDVAAGLRAHLRPHIPAFTLELAPGVGLAEDNGGAEGFGTRRCRVLADGIVRAHAQGFTGIDERLEAVAARFAEDGVDVDAPYREPAFAGRHVL